MLILHVLAQAAAAAAPTPAVAPQQGVISYPPAFFADFQPANASEMIARVPGFTLDSGDAVRGYEGSAGNVLIDGERPATKSEDLEGVLKRIPASRIERIDLIRGGAPGIDMQGKAVIANIVRKPGGGFRGVAAAALNNSWDGRHVPSVRLEGSGDIGPRRWELGVLVGGFIDDGDAKGHGVRISPTGRVTPVDIDSEGDGQNGQLTGVYETPILGGKVRLNGRLFSEKYKEEDNTSIPGPTPGFEQNVDHIRTDDTEIGGTFTRKFGDKTTLEVVGLRQTRNQAIDSDFTNGIASDFALRRESSETIGRTVLKYRATDRVSFEAGGEYAINKLDNATRLASNGRPVVLPAADVAVQEDRTQAFAKAVWRPTDQWTLDGTLRYESSDISSGGDVVLGKTLRYLKPRLAITWAPRTSTQVRLRAEREVGQLDFDDFVADANFSDSSGVSAGNPDLNPEQAWVGEAAVEQRFWGAGSATLTFRHYKLKDVVDRGPVFAPNGDIFDRPENIGDGTKDELKFQVSVPLANVGLTGATLRGDVTKRWSSVEDPTTHDRREISNLRPVEWNASYVHDIPAWNMTYGVDAFGGRRETAYSYNQVRTTKLSTYVRPFAEYRPRPDINLRLELPNVTGRGLRRTVLSYPGPRNAGSAPSLDQREYDVGQMVYFRIRKTLGG
ncbi:MAG: TonB-dependent receptor [Alphaproteobacteria bacterium]|nr:TonB-dependent receptor [Alphaproteobacteria bacterium]MBU1515627.1 TonB-dependent receptor [Alphaproteobacteria bacterium]MBU2096962.1 TonB-dependent receptor [Alphaproteobacteria bacterium]MBU2149617.1 TonB-dependent receptor [Alphaproteobacteria bacterium]MBU2305647.1 TonB-dependent receptor [Alphaproteobacteria bacterium]